VTRNHAIAGNRFFLHAEINAAVLDKHVPFFEGAFIEKQADPFPRSQLPLAMLRVDPFLASAEPRSGPLFFKLLNDILHVLSSGKNTA
jgi:hypothetical protein